MFWESLRDGSLERFSIVILVFGGIVVLLAKDGQVDERLFDVAFVIMGYFFRAIVEKFRSDANGSTKVLS